MNRSSLSYDNFGKREAFQWGIATLSPIFPMEKDFLSTGKGAGFCR
jgi:hypothetical protein